MRRAVALALMLWGCGKDPVPDRDDAGSRLEAAATAIGMVPDPDRASLTGYWARDTDKACIVPLDERRSRIGLLLDYGEGQGCVATGTARRHGAAVELDLGACRLTAGYDGERIVLPATVPDGCDRLCTGRATLGAFAVERVSESVSEAESLRAPSGKLLCAKP